MMLHALLTRAHAGAHQRAVITLASSELAELVIHVLAERHASGWTHVSDTVLVRACIDAHPHFNGGAGSAAYFAVRAAIMALMTTGDVVQSPSCELLRLRYS